MALVNRLIDVANEFRFSQGFYSRLYNDLLEMSEEDLCNINKQMEQDLGTQNVSDLDIILWLEQ